ncbi:MAG: PadR family transcriptional regulator, partial [Candidatus Heimdallarchaeota archaeon]|nr:PadR family transcriptional regulator [Candidatus Heimdallarchaeota archaeon]
IYPTLKKLEKDKLVSMKEIEGENRPNRKVYSITMKGLSYLKLWLALPIDTKGSNNLFIIMQELLLKVYLGNITSIETTSEFINGAKRGIEQGNAMLKLFEKNLRDHLDEDVDHYYYLMTVLMGIDVTEAVIKWTSKADKLLKEIQ